MALATAGLDELVDVIKDRRKVGRDGRSGICLLVGAGASISAGISSARGLIEKVEAKFPEIFDKLKARCGDAMPSYAQTMEALPHASQVALIRQEIAEARVNWAHLGIARLEAADVFDTLMTTNFDPLISRACALLNRFPAIYDLAALRDARDRIVFENSLVGGSAIYHLHGQYTGFALLSSTEKLKQQAERIRPVLEAEMRGKIIIIVGYSGENDPLIDEIANLNPGEHGLYWVCHSARSPHDSVCSTLLSKSGCFLIRNQPADRFFMSLANKLQIAVPMIFIDPLQHSHTLLRGIQQYSEVVETPYRNIHAEALVALDRAIKADRKLRPHYRELVQLLYAGANERILEQFDTGKALTLAEQSLVAWAAVAQGNEALKRAKRRSGPDEEKAFEEAFRQYRRGSVIQPRLYEPYNNLGIALQSRALKRPTSAANDLKDSCVAFEEAVRLHRNNAAIYRAWGVSLLQLGRLSKGAEASRYFSLARKRFHKARTLEPSNYDALMNIGNCNWFEACEASGKKREELQKKAEDAFLEVESAVPGACAYNLACCYGFQGKAKNCADWLRIANARGTRPLALAQLQKDTDLDPVRHSSEFQDAMKDIFR